jgi:hypothetical protein
MSVLPAVECKDLGLKLLTRNPPVVHNQGLEGRRRLLTRCGKARNALQTSSEALVYSKTMDFILGFSAGDAPDCGELLSKFVAYTFAQ